MTNLVAELDAVRVYRNVSEYRPKCRARCAGVEVVSDGMLMPALAQRLIEQGYSPDLMLSAERAGIVCLEPAPLHKWASNFREVGKQPAHLKRARND